MELRDTLGRSLRDLRVSVTDRCNFRCGYCMPRDVFGPDYTFQPRAALLTFEEIARVVAAAARLGVSKVRLTGGEPLLRRDLHRLVEMLHGIDGIDDIAMTTNGSLLAEQAASLQAAGLDRVTVSLDALDPSIFTAMSDTRVPVDEVLRGLAAADAAGLAPIKLNTVVQRGLNEDQIVPLATFARERGYVLRFIEYMDVGTTNGWQADDVVPAAEILDRLAAVYPVEDVADAGSTDAASRYRYADGVGEIGIVSSVSKPFCGTCVRARLSAVGELYTCLFAARGHDVRALVRSGASDAELEAFLAGIWGARADRYSELRSGAQPQTQRPEMSAIGG